MTADEVQDWIDRFLQIREATPVSEETLAEIEARLGIVLPADLRLISRVYRGEILGDRGHYEIAAGGPCFNITDKTLELRQSIALPHRYVVLDEPAVGLIVMETQSSAELPAPVTWLDAFDAERLATSEPFLGSPDVYASYAAFFAEMLEAELGQTSHSPTSGEQPSYSPPGHAMNLATVKAHYARNWSDTYREARWPLGPVDDLGPEFRVLEFPVRPEREWTYATLGMSRQPESGEEWGLELHLIAPVAAESHVELLTAVAHYHLNGHPLGLGHTVNFGRPWLPGSRCSYGLISLPYLDGPRLEWLNESEPPVRFLWLIPITGLERHFARENGVEALEERFEAAQFNYLDPLRASVV